MQGNGANDTGLNAGLSTSTSRYLSSGTGLTALPASITLASGSIEGGSRWVALS